MWVTLRFNELKKGDRVKCVTRNGFARYGTIGDKQGDGMFVVLSKDHGVIAFVTPHRIEALQRRNVAWINDCKVWRGE